MLKTKKTLAMFFLCICSLLSLNASFNVSEKELPIFSEKEILDGDITSLKGTNNLMDQRVDMDEDISGCADNYLRCARDFWIISEGWFGFGSMVGSVATTFIAGLTSLGGLDEKTKTCLETAQTVIGLSTTALISLQLYASKASKDRRKRLEQLILEHHEKV